ncbi:MAG: hypothetical protein FJ255_06045 [Phycisphaerae bacterium]|nr:hypothetical protein [Phycisphaerae bacterium]
MPARVACVILLALCLAGCGTTPARPVAIAPVERVVVPNGEYDVEFHSQWAGPVRGRMTFEATRGGFKANTRPGVAWDMVGGIESVLGPIFMPFLFPRGMVLVWSSTLPADDAEGRTVPGEGTIGVGDFESLRVRTQFASADAPITVRLRDGRAVGVMTLRPAEGDAPRAAQRTDYKALAQRTGELLREHLFDRRLLETPAFKSAWKGFTRNAGVAQDDAEFLFGAITAFRANLTTSMPLLFPRSTPAESTPLVEGLTDLVRPYRVIHDDKTGITTVRFYAFLESAAVDGAMAEALEHEPRALIVDIRRCPGVTLASLRLAALLLESPASVGVVFASARREIADLEALPVGLPTFAGVWSSAEASRVEAALGAEGVAELSVAPDTAASGRYAGPVAVLTSRRTSASAELLAHVLKQSGRALVVGEPTAGRPMLGREFDAGQDWTLIVPSLDHRPREGPRLNGRGVEPDRRSGRNAPGTAAGMLLERLGTSTQ